MIKYRIPDNWIKYDKRKIIDELIEAKSAVLSLTNVKYQRSWIEDLQELELKREVAGTSRIEGADFTEKEFEEALKETPDHLITRSQRQAHAAMRTYRWIEKLPNDIQITEKLLFDIHRKIVTDADDDHCPPGKLRIQDQNVTFGQPKHRGAAGGEECRKAFKLFIHAIENEFKEHDPLIQSLAAHYHFAAMHPFFDGNGRTGRALESFLLQRAGLKLTFFIAMSNYYNEEKTEYLKTLREVRAHNFDLSPFLKFGLKGISNQCKRLLNEINLQIAKALFRNVMFHLFGKLKTAHKRVIAERQIGILKLLLELDKNEISLDSLIEERAIYYKGLKYSKKAFVRDIIDLVSLGTITVSPLSENEFLIRLRLEWPTEITETDFFEKLKSLPTAKTHLFSI